MAVCVLNCMVQQVVKQRARENREKAARERAYEEYWGRNLGVVFCLKNKGSWPVVGGYVGFLGDTGPVCSSCNQRPAVFQSMDPWSFNWFFCPYCCKEEELRFSFTLRAEEVDGARHLHPNFLTKFNLKPPPLPAEILDFLRELGAPPGIIGFCSPDK